MSHWNTVSVSIDLSLWSSDYDVLLCLSIITKKHIILLSVYFQNKSRNKKYHCNINSEFLNHEILFSFDNKMWHNLNIFDLIPYQNISYTCTLCYIITKSRAYLSSFHDNKPTVFNTSGFVGSHSFPAHSVYTAWWAMVSSSSPFSKLPLPFCNLFIFTFQIIFQMSEKENFCILTRENTRLILIFTRVFFLMICTYW